MKRLILLLSILVSSSLNADFTLSTGVAFMDQLATSSNNSEKINDDSGIGTYLRIGGDVAEHENSLHTIDLEASLYRFSENNRDLFFNTDMLNYSYTHFFKYDIYATAGAGLGIAIANINKDINDIGFGFAYQTFNCHNTNSNYRNPTKRTH